MFRRILIANRGEIACRIIRACRALRVSPVAVYSDADIGALHVRLADESFRLGPPPPAESYLHADRLLEVARSAGVEAIHPGYGFLSENAEFASRCATAGFVFVGPTPAAMRSLGDKLSGRLTATTAQVPVIPGSSALRDPLHARDEAEKIGYPVVLKASGGGGGRGMRVVRSAAEMERSFLLSTGEARTAFGDPVMYLESYLEEPRHIEVQILGDRDRIVSLGERECSLQRRHQKILEESPAAGLDPTLRDRIGEAARSLARTAGYTNAGTVEFLVDGDRFYFLEVNARIQVEHPVTEMVTGVDLVQWQLRLAADEPLALRQEEVRCRGHAIEARINAEDPAAGFLPSPGTVTAFTPPAGVGIRVETGAEAGTVVTPYYDSLLAKVIVHEENRFEAITKLQEALRSFVVRGVRTLIPYHLDLLADPAILAGRYSTRFLEGFRRPDRTEELLAAAGVGALTLESPVRAVADEAGAGEAGSAGSWRNDGRHRARHRDPRGGGRTEPAPRWSRAA